MFDEKFFEILNYAIEREREAAEFYLDLQTKVELESSKLMLHELEMMEIGHIRILEKITHGEIEHFKPEQVHDLKISDFMLQHENPADMTYQDILVIAMKREEQSCDLYNALAEKTENKDVRNIFIKLANEEAKHKLQLETIYDDEILKEN